MLFSSFIYSQVGINTNSPDPSSALDIQSTNGGILIPRLTQDQRDAIAYPATGLLIFQTNESAGFYFYNGEQWTRIEGAGFEQNSEAAAEGITEVVAGYGLSGGGNTGQVTLDIDFTTFSTVMPGLTDYVVGFDQTGESLIRISDILALAPEGNPGPVGPQGEQGQDHKDHKVFKDLLDLRENKESRVSEETMVLMERKDHKENKDLLDRKDCKESRVFKDHKESKGLLDPLDQQDLKDHKGWQEQKVTMVQTDYPHMKHG